MSLNPVASQRSEILPFYFSHPKARPHLGSTLENKAILSNQCLLFSLIHLEIIILSVSQPHPNFNHFTTSVFPAPLATLWCLLHLEPLINLVLPFLDFLLCQYNSLTHFFFLSNSFACYSFKLLHEKCILVIWTFYNGIHFLLLDFFQF